MPSRSTTSASHAVGVARGERRLRHAPILPPAAPAACRAGDRQTGRRGAATRPSAGGGWCGGSTLTARCRTAWSTRLLRCAVRAPSAGFSQGWDFLVLARLPTASGSGPRPTEPDRARRLAARHLGRPGARRLPVRPGPPTSTATPSRTRAGPTGLDRWPVPYWDIDAGDGRDVHAARPPWTAASARSSSACRPRGTMPSAGLRRARPTGASSASSRSGYEAARSSAARPAPAAAGPLAEVAHEGRFGCRRWSTPDAL